LSLAVTTIFWGLGATLQFAVLRWAADVLGLPLSEAAYLQAAVAEGVGWPARRRLGGTCRSSGQTHAALSACCSG
jgi:hypothetical protein